MIAVWISELSAAGPALLVASALKSLIVLATAEVIVRQLRERSPAARHWVWALAVLACLALPLLTVVLPTWGLLPDWLRFSGAAGAASVSDGGGGGWYQWAIPIAAAIWLIGAALVLGRWLLGRASLTWLASESRRVVHGPLRAQLDRLADDMGMSRDVVLLVSERRAVPMTWGVWRPKLLLPAEVKGWSDERITSVMLHELAHLRRGDCLWQLAAQLACAVYWFHPYMWRASREMHIERESACDDLVLSVGVRATSYAESLLQLTRLASRGWERCSAVAMADEGRILESRVLAILDPRRVRAEPHRRMIWFSVLAVASLAPPIAMLGAVGSGDVASTETETTLAASRRGGPTYSPNSARVAHKQWQAISREPSMLDLLRMTADGDLQAALDSARQFEPGETVGRLPIALVERDEARRLDRHFAASWLEVSPSYDALAPAPSETPPPKLAPAAEPTDSHSRTSRLDRPLTLDAQGPMPL